MESLVKKIVVLGAPRSGTTWLGKIFDSHPDVLYRHEPDEIQPNYTFPFMINSDQVAEYITEARTYLELLCDQKSVRSVGKRPFFKKNHQSNISFYIRSSLIYLIQLGGRIPSIGSLFEQIQVPNFMPKCKTQESIYVVKSVISLGRASLYQKAMDKDRLVFIIRHPCGFVASELRGINSGKLNGKINIRALISEEESQKYNLSKEDLEQQDIIEKLSWLWVIINEKALAGLDGHDNVIIINHDEICEDPITQTQRLFKTCGLSWEKQTERFLLESSSYQHTGGYFGVRRNSLEEATKWRQELDENTIKKILHITNQTRAGEFFQ